MVYNLWWVRPADLDLDPALCVLFLILASCVWLIVLFFFCYIWDCETGLCLLVVTSVGGELTFKLNRMNLGDHKSACFLERASWNVHVYLYIVFHYLFNYEWAILLTPLQVQGERKSYDGLGGRIAFVIVGLVCN